MFNSDFVREITVKIWKFISDSMHFSTTIHRSVNKYIPEKIHSQQNNHKFKQPPAHDKVKFNKNFP